MSYNTEYPQIFEPVQGQIYNNKNGFTEKAKITTVYNGCDHTTTITVKGV